MTEYFCRNKSLAFSIHWTYIHAHGQASNRLNSIMASIVTSVCYVFVAVFRGSLDITFRYLFWRCCRLVYLRPSIPQTSALYFKTNFNTAQFKKKREIHVFNAVTNQQTLKCYCHLLKNC
jgi:hypothetical protein